MAKRNSVHILFNGRSSEEFGVYQVTSSGLQEESYLPNREIVEERIANRHKSYLFGTSYQPLDITLNLYIQDFDNPNVEREIFRWLKTDDYAPLSFSNQPHKIYYVMLNGESNIQHNSIDRGILSLSFRCNSPFAYSPTYVDRRTFKNNTAGEIVEINNSGIEDTFLDLNIIKDTLGDITITNLSNGNEFTLKNSLANEEIEIDSENEIINTSLINTYRFSDFKGDFIKLVPGINRIKVVGNGEFEFKHSDILT